MWKSTEWAVCCSAILGYQSDSSIESDLFALTVHIYLCMRRQCLTKISQIIMQALKSISFLGFYWSILPFLYYYYYTVFAYSRLPAGVAVVLCNWPLNTWQIFVVHIVLKNTPESHIGMWLIWSFWFGPPLHAVWTQFFSSWIAAQYYWVSKCVL